MAEARTRSLRIRSRAAGLFAAAYVMALTSFWVAGAVAYAQSGEGWSRLLGLAYFPILLLPVVGRGTLGGLEVPSSIWLWWFALQMVLGVAAIWLYPYGPRRHRRLSATSAASATPVQSGAPQPSGGSLAGSDAAELILPTSLPTRLMHRRKS